MSRIYTDREEQDAISFARSDYLAGKMNLNQFEAEVEDVLRGESKYLPAFEAFATESIAE